MMANYSVADAKNGLPGLIDKARAGEHVVITRHGRPVAELRPTQSPITAGANSYSWLKTQRTKRKAVSTTSVELLRAMYEDEA